MWIRKNTDCFAVYRRTCKSFSNFRTQLCRPYSHRFKEVWPYFASSKCRILAGYLSRISLYIVTSSWCINVLMTKSPSDLTFIRVLLGSLLTLIWAGSEHPLGATLFLFPSSRKALERVGLSNKNPLFIITSKPGTIFQLCYLLPLKSWALSKNINLTTSEKEK